MKAMHGIPYHSQLKVGWSISALFATPPANVAGAACRVQTNYYADEANCSSLVKGAPDAVTHTWE